ncbi:MAG: hypothetical protein WD004_07145 [Actinomycetota bacterium]
MDGRSRVLKRAAVGVAAILALAITAGSAVAAITWEGANVALQERPNTSGSAAQDSNTWEDGNPMIAISNGGTAATNYVHMLWETDKSPGVDAYPYVDYTAACSVTDPAPMALPDPPYCSGIYYSRSADITSGGAGTWTAPVRMNTTTSHSRGASIAAAGSNVYVVSADKRGYYTQSCNADPSPLRFRSSTTHGGLVGAWGAMTLLGTSDVLGEYEYPTIAASGTNVYVIATSMVNDSARAGNIVLFRSTNSGGTFTSQTIGKTTSRFETYGVSTGCNLNATGSGGVSPTPLGLEGWSGYAFVSSTGDATDKVGAVWVRSDTGKIVAKVSVDGGATWPGGANGAACTAGGTDQCTQNLIPSGGKGMGYDYDQAAGGCATTDLEFPAGGGPDPGPCGVGPWAVTAAAPGRIGFAWTSCGAGNNFSGCSNQDTTAPRGVYFRLYTTAGGWSPKRLVACLSNCPSAPAAGSIGASYNGAYGLGLAPWGNTGWGIIFSACPIQTGGLGGAIDYPCSENDTAPTMGVMPAVDPGAEILYKESGNNGAGWNGDWTIAAGTACTTANACFHKVASNAGGGATCGIMGVEQCVRVAEYANLIYDRQSNTTNGCAQPVANGVPEVPCTRFINYLGRPMSYYYDYKAYLKLGINA